MAGDPVVVSGVVERLGVPVAEGIVGEYFADRYTVVAEPFGDSVQESRCGGVFIVGMRFDVSDPGVVIDSDMEVVVADPTVLGCLGVTVPSPDLPSSAVRDTGQFLHIDMQQLSRPGPFITPDRSPGGPIDPIETVQPHPAQHLVDRRTRDPRHPRDPMRPPASPDPQHHHPPYHLR